MTQSVKGSVNAEREETNYEFGNCGGNTVEEVPTWVELQPWYHS